jgi:hypothetical protein
MLHVINSITDPLIKLINDDPVRPEIPVEFRVAKDNEVFVLLEEDVPQAVVCVTYKDYIPDDESQLIHASEIPSTAVFYTIWSYKSGAGRKLIRQAKKYIEENRPSITKFVTLSPRTEMARKFHLNNGASVFRENETSVNYEYH